MDLKEKEKGLFVETFHKALEVFLRYNHHSQSSFTLTLLQPAVKT
jgi:hypothetical protein